MAIIYPEEILDDTKSSAERKLFEIFKNELSNDFTVFHSVAWVSRTNKSGTLDKEIDFLIAHPQKGILVIEVKGGRIQFDGSTGNWSSVDRNGKTHNIKNPINQAKDARYSLYRKLKTVKSTRMFKYPIYHAICFPDITVEHDIKLDIPKMIVIDQYDIGRLETTINHIYEYWGRNIVIGAPTSKGINALVSLLAPSITLTSNMGDRFIDEKQKIKRLTKQQFMTLDLLSRENRAIVFGCAGSGKTMLALEKARRLSIEDHSVLVTCYNSRLAYWLNKTQPCYPGVSIVHFHKLCIDIATKANIKIPTLSSDVVQNDQEYYFGFLIPQLLIDAAERIGPQFNAIIADEGQDFYGNWWIALESLLVDPDKDIFYIFCDDNQNIYTGNEVEYPFLSPSISLNINCRNTRKIYEKVMEHYRGPINVQGSGPIGRRPEIVHLSSNNALLPSLSKKIHNTVYDEKIPAQEVVILTPKSQITSILKTGTKLGNFSLTWKEPESNEIECSTIHSFKGLERPVVMLVEMEQYKQEEISVLYYIGASRASNHLIVFYPPTTKK